MENLYCIYKITNLLTKKIYIGKARDFNERVTQHKVNARLSRKDLQTYLYRAVRKYGIDNFTFECLELCKKEEANSKEIYWIEKYKSNNKEFGYNLSIGGTGGDTISQHKNNKLIRKRMSKAGKLAAKNRPKDNRNLLQKMTAKYGREEAVRKFKEVTTKISNSKKGYRWSKAMKKKLSIAHKHQKPTKESIRKGIETKKLKKYPQEKVDLILRLYVNENLSLKKVSALTNINRLRIKRVLFDNNIKIIKRVNQYETMDT